MMPVQERGSGNDFRIVKGSVLDIDDLMAVWQFQATLVPFATAVDHGLLPGHRLSDAQREEIAWWSGKTVAVEKLQQLSKVLPAGKSWTEELEVFGDLETTCVTIFSDRGAVVEVNARLDLRTLSAEAGKAVLAFARGLECLLVTDDNLMLKPESSDLGKVIKTSPAYRFVSSPHTFFSRLASLNDGQRP
jgi:hypothetical protein